MKSMIKLGVSLFLSVTISQSYALAPPGHWECRAFDSNNRSYSAIAKQRNLAIAKSYDKCRANSRVRATCRTAQSFCNQGPLSLIDNRCVASDENGRSWNTTGVNACKTAVSLCNQWQFRHGNTRGSTCLVRHR